MAKAVKKKTVQEHIEYINSLMTPVKDLVVVIKVKKADTVTGGGIVLPEAAMEDQRKHEFGVVMAAGEGAFVTQTGERMPMEVKVGDRVAFVDRAGWGFRFEGVEYQVIRETDVWVVLKKFPFEVRAAIDEGDQPDIEF